MQTKGLTYPGAVGCSIAVRLCSPSKSKKASMARCVAEAKSQPYKS